MTFVQSLPTDTVTTRLKAVLVIRTSGIGLCAAIKKVSLLRSFVSHEEL
jgi:hypothetical protein